MTKQLMLAAACGILMFGQLRADQACDGRTSAEVPVANTSGSGFGGTQASAEGNATDNMCGGAPCAACPAGPQCPKDIEVCPKTGHVSVTSFQLWSDPDLWYAYVEVVAGSTYKQTCVQCS